jgi:Xaa-Pro aminopeptidase
VSIYAERRARLLELLAEAAPKERADAILVSFLPNVRYLTGFTGSNALLLVAPGASVIATDPRYELQVANETDCPAVVFKRGSLYLSILPLLRKRGFRKLGFEGAHLTCDLLEELQSGLTKTRMTPQSGLIESIRTVKSPDEIERIRRSVRICSEAFEASAEHCRPGISENFLAAEIEFQMRTLGAEKPAFETIVASGPRSAWVHAHPSGDPILANELLLVDMGAQCEGYASDMTRMIFPGTPTRKVKQIYRAVLEAQLAALDAVKPGVSTVTVDGAARRVLAKSGLADRFVHSTGHGLGLEIHELPRIAKRQPSKLRAGMVITIEPGVYLEGFGGIRVEDTVLVTPGGSEILTPTSKELLVI